LRALPLWLISFLLFLTSLPNARGDGGTLRLTERQGGYRIAVFTAPNPLRAGPVDVSVFVQDAETGQPAPDVSVTISVSRVGPSQPRVRYPATPEAATNKLYRAAQFELPAAGRWRLEIAVDGPRGPAQVQVDVEAAEALPRWRELWPWIALPAVPILFFCLHQWLARAEKRSRDCGLRFALAKRKQPPRPGI
jgi:hypothetical protein